MTLHLKFPIPQLLLRAKNLLFKRKEMKSSNNKAIGLVLSNKLEIQNKRYNKK